MKRRVAREIVILSLYQIEMNDVTLDEAVEAVLEEARHDNEVGIAAKELEAVDAYARELLNDVYRKRDALDQQLVSYLTGWHVDRLSRVDRQILRLALYEMEYRQDDVPPKVAINEAIELAKRFGLEENGKFVNGVLGRMMKEKAGNIQGDDGEADERSSD